MMVKLNCCNRIVNMSCWMNVIPTTADSVVIQKSFWRTYGCVWCSFVSQMDGCFLIFSARCSLVTVHLAAQLRVSDVMRNKYWYRLDYCKKALFGIRMENYQLAQVVCPFLCPFLSCFPIISPTFIGEICAFKSWCHIRISTCINKKWRGCFYSDKPSWGIFIIYISQMMVHFT